VASSIFSDWTVWSDSPILDAISLKETLDGGQAFRWNALEAGAFEGRWNAHVVRIRPSVTCDHLEYAIPKTACPKASIDALNTYWATGIDYSALTDQLPWRSDPVIRTAIEAFPTLRILKQPFEECLFSFLCSSTKQVPQIKAIHEMVALRLGNELPDGSHALPTWSQIASGGEAPLRDAKLGYRARYINQCAQVIVERPGWLASVEQMPTADAREELLRLPGVGRKIADCVLLFGAGRLDAFPIDTWVQKILGQAYSLKDWNLNQLQQFAQIHFGQQAGYAQQFRFAAARAGKLRL